MKKVVQIFLFPPIDKVGQYLETENAVFWEAQKKGDVNLIRKEAIQVAAVAVRLAVMLTPATREMYDVLEQAEAEVG